MATDSIETVSAHSAVEIQIDRERATAIASPATTTVALLATIMCVAYAATPDSPSVGSERPAILTGVNANYAPWPELVQLPGIGETKALAIVDYRESVCPDGLAGCARSVFQRPRDLENVHGIGPKTVNRVSHHLRFGGR